MSPKKEDAGDWMRAVREAAPYLGLGSTMAFSVLLSLGAGYWMDGRFGTTPLFILLGGAFGMFAAFYHLIKSVSERKR